MAKTKIATKSTAALLVKVTKEMAQPREPASVKQDALAHQHPKKHERAKNITIAGAHPRKAF